MTHTLVASQSREVVIGFDKPFCVIGERINPTWPTCPACRDLARMENQP